MKTQNFKNKLKQNPKPIALAVLATIFFILYSWLYIVDGDILNSPDELSNLQFSQEFKKDKDFQIDRSRKEEFLIQPRSVNINQSGNYVPVGFLGMPLIFGSLAKLLGNYFLQIGPAIIAILGVYSFYGILRRIFSEDIAFLSTVLLFFFPPWWYFASRGFLPNVPLLSFSLIGGYLFLRTIETADNTFKKLSFLTLSGFSFCTAFLIRPIITIWLLPIFIISFWSKRKKIFLKDFIVLLSVLLVCGLGYLYFANQTYGGFFVTGYDSLSVNTLEQAGPITRASSAFFPFGFEPIKAINKLWLFSLKTLWPFLALFIIGIVSIYKKTTVQKKYTTVFIGLLIYLVMYYGSWDILDHPDPDRVSIGISYMRYWLPAYILALPIVVVGIQSFASRLKFVSSKLVVLFTIVLLISWSSFVVYAQEDDNLGEIVQDVVNYQEIKKVVLESTPEDSVILSQRNDKLFWPQREVIHFQDQRYEVFVEVADLLPQNSVYWFTALPISHIKEIEESYLLPNGISIDSNKDDILKVKNWSLILLKKES